jgi:uncharacterized damage-inducible protein DinB
MSERDRLLDLFDRTHAGDAWHGPSLHAALDGVTAAQAAAYPVAGAHSIWEIVLHISGWREEVVKRLRGRSASEPDDGDWPTPPPASPDAWRAARDRLDATHQLVVQAVRALSEADLETAVRDTRDDAEGAGPSYALTLHGLVHHDVYHAGQISLLKRALR